MIDGRTLYDSPVRALVAAAEAAAAPMYGVSRCYEGGWGLWTTREKAEVMAEGLRLTGYRVSLKPGYSVGVMIHDDDR